MREMRLAIIAFMDSPGIFDSSILPVPRKTLAPTQIVASLAGEASQIIIHNGIGSDFIGIYKGAANEEVLIAGTGVLGVTAVEIYIPAGTRISIRSFGSVDLTSGSLFIKFLGTKFPD